MKWLLKAEELILFGISIWIFSTLKFAWWWFPVLLFAPDLSMIGYLFGTKVGAVVYNVVHHKALGIVVFAIGTLIQLPWLQLTGVILFGHSCLDRTLGYGLKYTDSFVHTHLDDGDNHLKIGFKRV